MTFTDAYGIKHNISDLYAHIKKEEDATCLSFRGGLESFLELFEYKLIIPQITIIRIDDGDIGRHYQVLSRDKLKGLSSEAYEGPEGIHNVGKCFEESESFSLEGVFIPSKYGIRNRNWDIYDEYPK